MDISLFKDFRAKAALGRRRDAAVSLGAFIRSLDTLAKKRQFTEWLLAQRDGRRMAQRHELRTDVVLPVHQFLPNGERAAPCAKPCLRS